MLKAGLSLLHRINSNWFGTSRVHPLCLWAFWTHYLSVKFCYAEEESAFTIQVLKDYYGSNDGNVVVGPPRPLITGETYQELEDRLDSGFSSTYNAPYVSMLIVLAH